MLHGDVPLYEAWIADEIERITGMLFSTGTLLFMRESAFSANLEWPLPNNRTQVLF